MALILVVDDEEHIVELIRYTLEREGYQVLTARDGVTALRMARDYTPDLIVLDVMLPKKDGLTVCQELRRDDRMRHVPMVMLSALTQEMDRVVGLELGADDYITKPFSVRELAARVKAHLRHGGAEDRGGLLSYGGLTMDPARYTIGCGPERITLTPKEFELLSHLMRQRGRVFTREELLEQVWGYDYEGDSRTVDVHVRHIRQKLAGLPQGKGLIETVRGIGYRLRDE